MMRRRLSKQRRCLKQGQLEILFSPNGSLLLTSGRHLGMNIDKSWVQFQAKSTGWFFHWYPPISVPKRKPAKQPIHYGLSNVIIRDQKFAKVCKSKTLILAHFLTKRAQFFFKRSKTDKILQQIFFQIFFH